MRKRRPIQPNLVQNSHSDKFYPLGENTLFTIVCLCTIGVHMIEIRCIMELALCSEQRLNGPKLSIKRELPMLCPLAIKPSASHKGRLPTTALSTLIYMLLLSLWTQCMICALSLLEWNYVLFLLTHVFSVSLGHNHQ